MTVLRRREFVSGAACALGVLGGCLGGDDRTAWTATDDSAGGIAVADGTAYVGTIEDVYAIDVESGDVLWTYRGTHREIDRPPTVRGEDVFVGVNGGEGVHAIESGTRKWQFDDVVNDASRPVVRGEAVFVVAGKHLYEIDRVDGTERRRLELEEFRPSTPVVTDRSVYLVTDRELRAIDRSSFDRQWSHPTQSHGFAVDDERVYLSSSERGGLTALDREDGTVLWTGDSDRLSDFVVTGDSVYASARGGLVAYSRDGRERWTSELQSAVSRPAPDDDALYSVDIDSKRLYATDVVDGGTNWRVEFDDHPRYGPTPTADLVLVPTTGGIVAVEK